MKKIKHRADKRRGEHTVSVQGIAPEPREKQRAGGRGYTGRVSRYLRLSISLRASLGYSWLLWRLLIPLLLILTIGYGFLQAPNYAARQRHALAGEPVTGVTSIYLPPGTPEDTFIGAVQTLANGADTPAGEAGIRIGSIAPTSGEAAQTASEIPAVYGPPEAPEASAEIGADAIRGPALPEAAPSAAQGETEAATEEEPNGFIVAEGWGVAWTRAPLRIYAQYVTPYDEAGARTRLLFSLDEDWRVLKGLYLCATIMLVFASISFLTRGRHLNEKLLRPIGEIAETAQRMSEKNLSARINVAGTQNELRDLAVVINDMLNRIEAAYNRQKQFVSDASHELRTPIAVIQGYAGMLERWGKDNPEVLEESIAAISGETQSMKELVENLLFLARHDKKTLTLSFEPFDSAEMLHELLKETEIIARSHNILTGEIAEATLVADRASIKQAVRVFVDNALKYTPPGGSVEVASRLHNQSLQITVSDSGPGIKKEELARIFDRFYRSDSARNSQTGGHGLGLAIARIIVASHGGRIHAKSKPGMGSAFTLEVPLVGRAD